MVLTRLDQCGLSLLEVLVSLVVAVLFLGYLLPGATAALRRVQKADLEAEATGVARNHVELLSAWPAVAPEPSTGTSGALRWSVQQIAIDGAGKSSASVASLRTFRITVSSPSEPMPLVDMTVQRLSRAP